ncbi:DMT family transporter [Marinobacter nanhaiticus D15-8W]|uniref:DMT family transporter n=1 Tax=Marinobacter nanhaiticus D15-8W TaxID=626887 RepID=N6WQ53_9GAMM|nr:DMT family transporter [Marinobacter nanhaiticus]ENO13172.1 DMT family transporter [Marinobacter nanhaiticus D15-8W]
MKNQKQALMFGAGTVLLWSTVATAFKLSLRDLTPLQLMLIACATSVAVMAGVLVAQKRLPMLFELTRRQYLVSVVMGLLNPLLYYLVLFEAFDRLPAQEAQPLNYTWALTLAYLSVPLLGQRLSRADIVAGLICYSGVVVIATHGDVLALEFSDPIGVFMALASTVVWAVYWIATARDTRDPLVGLFLNFLFSLPFIVVICMVVDGLPTGSNTALMASVYIGVFEMGIAFVLWMFAMKKAENTSQVSNLIFISPFLSLIFIHFILGEEILESTYVGLVLIVVGLWWQQRGRKRDLAAEAV